MLTVSQIATGEENNLRLRIYGSEAALLWEQENPNCLSVFALLPAAQTSPAATASISHRPLPPPRACPTGHPEGYIEAFATIYCGLVAGHPPAHRGEATGDL